MNKTTLGMLTLVGLAPFALSAQPTTNPVTASGLDFSGYDLNWTNSMVNWANVTTTAAVPNDATDDLAVVQAEIYNLSTAGGGVLYFPAGTYDFSNDLYLAHGVVLRGADPSTTDCRGTYTGTIRSYTLTYDPPTNFQFPLFQQDTSGWTKNLYFGSPDRTNYFKKILVDQRAGNYNFVSNQSPNQASNYGMVNIDIDGAPILVGDNMYKNRSFPTDIRKNLITAKNILFFGLRMNNGTWLEEGVPAKANMSSSSLTVNRWYYINTAGTGCDFTNVGAPNNNEGTLFQATGTTPTAWGTGSQLFEYKTPGSGGTGGGIYGQNKWQVWPTRTRGKIDIESAGNTLVANCLISDKYYKNDILGGSETTMNYVCNLKPAGGAASTRYLKSNGADYNNTTYTQTEDRASFADGYGIRLNHVQDYLTAHTPVVEPMKYRQNVGVINNWVYTTTRVAIQTAGAGLVVKNNARDDFHTDTKLEVIPENGNGAEPTGSTTLENRGLDISAGVDVLVEGNYFKATRGLIRDGYLSTDGEGLLLQESSGGIHYDNWTIKNNVGHNYMGIYKVVYSGSTYFEGNTITGNSVYVNASRNNAFGRISGTLSFKNNTSNAHYGSYSILARNSYNFVDGGGNTPAPTANTYAGTVNNTDSTPKIEILFPTWAYLQSVPEGTVVPVQVKVTRDPLDTNTVAGVKLWDMITNYPANSSIGPDGTTALPAGYWTAETGAPTTDNGLPSTVYWNYTGGVVGKPAGLALTDGDADGIYTGNWTVPVGFKKRGYLCAEVRLSTVNVTNVDGGASTFVEMNWALMNAGSFGKFAQTYSIPGDSLTTDSDNDGIPNLMEYALNLNPTASSVLPLAVTSDGSDNSISFTAARGAVGAKFQLQKSSDMSTWSDVSLTGATVSDIGNDTLKYTVSETYSGPTFYRLKAVTVD